MNELAREALVTAALKGVPQIKGHYRDLNGGPGRCAMGVIYENAGLLFSNQNVDKSANFVLLDKYGITLEDWQDIVDANDDKGWDFLTIARKIGNDDAVDAVKLTQGLTQEDTK
jgi:hypothetical protein